MVNYVKVTNFLFQNKIFPELNSKKHTPSPTIWFLRNCGIEFRKSGIGQFCSKWLLRMIAQIVVFFRAKLMRKERKILRFVPQKLRKSFANRNPKRRRKIFFWYTTWHLTIIRNYRRFSSRLWIPMQIGTPAKNNIIFDYFLCRCYSWRVCGGTMISWLKTWKGLWRTRLISIQRTSLSWTENMETKLKKEKQMLRKSLRLYIIVKGTVNVIPSMACMI